MKKLYSETFSHNHCGHWHCGLCGEEYEESLCGIHLCDETPDAADICPTCVDAGPAGAAERMMVRATRMRESAAALELWALEIKTASPWATSQDLKKLSDEIVRERMSE